MTKGAFLDRDGVLNANVKIGEKVGPPRFVSEVELLPGVTEAIDLLRRNNYLPIVITNQPDVARGTQSLSQVNSINSYIGEKTGIFHFYVCPHDTIDQCQCRKPKPGLIEIATKELEIDLNHSFLVGDRWKDIEAGQAASLPSFFIDNLYTELNPVPPFTRVSSLLEAVRIRIGESNASRVE